MVFILVVHHVLVQVLPHALVALPPSLHPSTARCGEIPEAWSHRSRPGSHPCISSGSSENRSHISGHGMGRRSWRFALSSQPHLVHRMFFMRGSLGSTVGLKLHAGARVASQPTKATWMLQSDAKPVHCSDQPRGDTILGPGMAHLAGIYLYASPSTFNVPIGLTVSHQRASEGDIERWLLLCHFGGLGSGSPDT